MSKPDCKYGANCYQKNPLHRSMYNHNFKDQETKTEIEEPPKKRFKPESEEAKEKIKDIYGMDMPADFYDFWDFCKSLKNDEPEDALAAASLQLVGPYDILAGKFEGKDFQKEDGFVHWRFFYDPPEFQTVLRSVNDSGFHFGYFRDDPSAMPAFVASNDPDDGCKLEPQGQNLFAAAKLHLTTLIGGKLQPSKRMSVEKIYKAVTDWAKRKDYNMEKKTKEMKARRKDEIVVKTFHGAGLVVPIDANDVGYREVPESKADLKKMLKGIDDAENDDDRIKAFDPLQELLSFVQFANDECDYGMGLELGLDLFCYGSNYLTKTVLRLLPLGYELIGRNLYAEIIKAHLSNRRKGNNLSRL